MTRATGGCATVAGALWAAGAVVQSSLPRGCVADECLTHVQRQSSPAANILLGTGAVLVVVSGAGLLVLTRRAGRLGRTGVLGGAAACLGVLMLIVASVVSAMFYDDDFPLMPYFVLPAVALLAIGLMLVAWTVLRARVVPRWAAVLLVLGALLLLGSNDQTSAMLLAVPFGLAWAVSGVVLWARAVVLDHGPTAVVHP